LVTIKSLRKCPVKCKPLKYIEGVEVQSGSEVSQLVSKIYMHVFCKFLCCLPNLQKRMKWELVSPVLENSVCSFLVPVLPGLSLNITVNTRECFWLAALWVIGYSSTHFDSAQMEGGNLTSRPHHLQGKNPQY